MEKPNEPDFGAKARKAILGATVAGLAINATEAGDAHAAVNPSEPSKYEQMNRGNVPVIKADLLAHVEAGGSVVFDPSNKSFSPREDEVQVAANTSGMAGAVGSLAEQRFKEYKRDNNILNAIDMDVAMHPEKYTFEEVVADVLQNIAKLKIIVDEKTVRDLVSGELKRKNLLDRLQGSGSAPNIPTAEQADADLELLKLIVFPEGETVQENRERFADRLIRSGIANKKLIEAANQVLVPSVTPQRDTENWHALGEAIEAAKKAVGKV